MIVLDTHIWIWWINESTNLTSRNLEIIQSHQANGWAVSIISCWEVAKLVEKGRLSFDCSVDEWLELALAYPGITLIDLTVPIILQSTRLVGFHNDPADQIIVATAKTLGISLLTQDHKILNYPHVETAT